MGTTVRFNRKGRTAPAAGSVALCFALGAATVRAPMAQAQSATQPSTAAPPTAPEAAARDVPPTSASGVAPTTEPTQASDPSTRDYRINGKQVSIFASPAAQAVLLGSMQFAQPIRQLVSYQGLVVVSLSPTGLVLVDARNPTAAQVRRRLAEPDIQRLEIDGAVARYTSATGEQGQSDLLALAAQWDSGGTAPQDPRCAAVNGSSPAEVRVEGSTLRVVDAATSGRCWQGTLRLPGPAAQSLPSRGVVYITLRSGGLAVVDARDPRHPRLVQRSEIFCPLQDLELDTETNELQAKTPNNVDVRWNLADALRPALQSQAAVAGCYQAGSQAGPSLPGQPQQAPLPAAARPGVDAVILCDQPRLLGDLIGSTGRIELRQTEHQRVRLRRYQTYLVNGDFPTGTVPPIQFPSASITIHAGSNGMRTGGGILLGLGIALDVAGIGALVFSAFNAAAIGTANAFDSEFNRGRMQLSYNEPRDAAIAGGVLLGLGLAATAGGVVALVSSSTRVHVEQDTN